MIVKYGEEINGYFFVVLIFIFIINVYYKKYIMVNGIICIRVVIKYLKRVMIGCGRYFFFIINVYV